MIDLDNKEEADPTESEIRRLAGLSDLAYEKERSDKAKALGIRTQMLDRLVKQAKVEVQATAAGHDEVVSDVEPWDSPVNGGEVAQHIVETLKRHTVMPPMGYEAIALWCIGSYVFDAFRIFPRLCLHSPQKRCGKTTTLELVEAFSHRTLIGSNVSASVLFRAIEAWQPTILADEADTWIHGNEELRGVINSGHNRRTARVFRTEEVNGERIPVAFSTWAPLALAMIKTPPDTIMDRSVVVNLRRRSKGENVHKLPANLFEQQLVTRRKLVRWAADNMDELRSSEPVLPEINNDRAGDNWHSMFAIAEALGGEWAKTAKKTMKVLEGAKPEDEDVGAMLLEDVRNIFSDWTHDNIFSEYLTDALVGLEGRPWSEWRRGQPMTKNSLARLLKPYGIRPNTVRVGLTTQKGYPVGDFLESFTRYLPDLPNQTVTTSQASAGVAPERDGLKTQNVTVTVEPSHRNANVTPRPSSGVGCDDVTDETPKYGRGPNGDIPRPGTSEEGFE